MATKNDTRATSGDAELDARILEEGMKEYQSSGNADLLTSQLHNLKEIGAEGSMTDAYKVDKERDGSYMTVYSTVDGTPSTVLKTMVPKMMRKRLPRIPEVPREKWGQLAFSLTPTEVPNRMRLMCDLHPDSARRDWLDTIGLAGRLCSKENLVSPYEVERHRRIYHPDEDAAIRLAEGREIERETLAYQRAIAEMIKAQVKEG